MCCALKAPYRRRMTHDDSMPRRRIGSSGLEAGAVGLGCMGMTWAYTTGERDDEPSTAVIHRAIELGVTLIDTADMYGPFTNEALVGRALQGRRDEVVLATKGRVEENAGAASLSLGPEDLAELDATPSAVGDRH
jgi:diketogulonate reductase-like aldo/keto reductase